jgi:hypothetical protein
VSLHSAHSFPRSICDTIFTDVEQQPLLMQGVGMASHLITTYRRTHAGDNRQPTSPPTGEGQVRTALMLICSLLSCFLCSASARLKLICSLSCCSLCSAAFIHTCHTYHLALPIIHTYTNTTTLTHAHTNLQVQLLAADDDGRRLFMAEMAPGTAVSAMYVVQL